MKMGRYITGIALVLIVGVGNWSHVFAQGKGQVGSAGAGTPKNGRLVTFYSAGFFVDQKELAMDEVPSLIEILDAVRKIPGLSEGVRAKYLQGLWQPTKRKYYKVKSDARSKKGEQELIQIYASIMDMSVEDVKIYARTDFETGETFLFPEFDQLSPVEKMAALFHEAYWALNPPPEVDYTVKRYYTTNEGYMYKRSFSDPIYLEPVISAYKEVIAVEMAMQHYLESPNERDRIINLLRTIGDQNDLMNYALSSDLENSNLSGLISSDHTIPIKDLFGSHYTSCLMDLSKPYSDCSPAWVLRVHDLIKTHPESQFVKLLGGLDLRRLFGDRGGFRDPEAHRHEFLENATLRLDPNSFDECLIVNWPSTYIESTSYFLWMRWDNTGEIEYHSEFCMM